MAAGNGPRRAGTHHSRTLPATHEALAESYAAKGEWRRAYEHLRTAMDLSRTSAPQARPPEQYRREVEQLRRERAQARHESLTDSLTAAYNRRYLDRRLAMLASPAVALLDLDLFKHVNDRFGHLVGDQVLQRVVLLLRQCLPSDAFCARYGGEEFALVLPRGGRREAIAITERARIRVAEHPWSELRAGLAVTISAGVVPEAEPPGGPHDQLLEADSLLYEAKRAGRNLVAFREHGRVRVIRTVGAAQWGDADAETVRTRAAQPCP
ncbi:GGDEF domain-containing protein [Saccharomonospora sp. NPDC006951]